MFLFHLSFLICLSTLSYTLAEDAGSVALPFTQYVDSRNPLGVMPNIDKNDLIPYLKMVPDTINRSLQRGRPPKLNFTSSHATSLPSSEPSSEPSVLPTSVPTLFPSIVPSVAPTFLSTSLSFLQSDTFLIICVGSALVLCLAFLLFLKRKCYKKINNQSLVTDDNANDEESAVNNLDCFSIEDLRIPEDLKVDPLSVTLGKIIGQGSFAKVHVATYKKDKELPVAMKVLQLGDQGFSYKQFNLVSKEIDVLTTFLPHKNIVTLLGICVNTILNSHYGISELACVGIMMELSTIGTLTKYLQNPSTAFRMTAKLCESLALDISHGLNALHSCYPPFIHRDLKGENILLFSGTSHNGENIVAKIADFGIVSSS